jgi:hypothetical protein
MTAAASVRKGHGVARAVEGIAGERESERGERAERERERERRRRRRR